MLPRSDVAERSQAQTAQIDAQANALGVQASQNAVQNVMGGIDMAMRNARANQMLRMQEAQMRFQASIEEGRGKRADRYMDIAERQQATNEERTQSDLRGAAIAQRRDQISVEMAEQEARFASVLYSNRAQLAQTQAMEADVRYQSAIKQMEFEKAQFAHQEIIRQYQQADAKMTVLGRGPVDMGDGQYAVVSPIEGSDRVDFQTVGPDDPRVKRFLEQQELGMDTERTRNEVMRARAMEELQGSGVGIGQSDQPRLQTAEVRRGLETVGKFFDGDTYKGPADKEQEMRDLRSSLMTQLAGSSSMGGEMPSAGGMQAGGGVSDDILGGISEQLGVPPQAVAQNLDKLVQMRAFQAARQNQPFDAESEARRILGRALAQPGETDAQQILRYLKTGKFQ